MEHHNKINKNKQPSLTPKNVQTQGAYLQDNRPSSILQRKANNTGLPDNLKSGIENLSSHSMDDVKVHYNSEKPAQLNAHAYAQGTDIHIASGQEKHLPHEAWHVVQQKQGRVQPTMQMKGKVNVNDEASLEKEADLIGRAALQRRAYRNRANYVSSPIRRNVVQRVKFEPDDIHGFESLRKIIHQQLEIQKINPEGTLFVSVGSSPVVFTNYLEMRGAKVVYVPMSGLSAYGKVYETHTEKYGSEHGFDRDIEERGANIFHQAIGGNLTDVQSVVVVDFGTSGGSNRAAYEIVSHYLRYRKINFPVRMATLVKPATEATDDINHADNLMRGVDLGLVNEAVKRVLWVMHLQIDKQFSPFEGKYNVSEHIIGSKPPQPNREKLSELNIALNNATKEYFKILKRPGSFIPTPNTLGLFSDKSTWVSHHRKTLIEKIKPSNKTLFKLIILLMAIVLFYWDAIMNRFKRQVV